MLNSIRRIAIAEVISISLWAFLLFVAFFGNYLPVLNFFFNPHAESGVYGMYLFMAGQAIVLVSLIINIPMAIKDLLKFFQERKIEHYTILFLGIILAVYISYILFPLVLKVIH